MDRNLDNFRELGVAESIIPALERKGFTAPTPIQAACIPRLLAGDHDIIGQAGTGTGKTAAFAIPILQTVKAGGRSPKALVLTPTRELAMQVAGEMASFAGDSGVGVAVVYGGQSIELQMDRLKRGVDVVIGTPGRVIDLMKRGRLVWDELEFAVLDEADEMLNMGFIDDIKMILETMPENKRTLLFSATMPAEIRAIAEEFMRDTEVVAVARDSAGAGTTEEVYYEVFREDKPHALRRILDMENDLYAMVFCRTKGDVDELTALLQKRGVQAEALHGDLPQAQRTKVIARFRRRDFRLLIATDVAARGIDVNDLTHVINFSIPQSVDSYVHRIGRTGRAGKNGMAITFVTPGERKQLERIRREAAGSLKKGRLPQGGEIVEAKKAGFVERLAQYVEAGSHNDYIGFAEELLTACDHPAEYLAAMLRMHFGDELLEASYPALGSKPPAERPPRSTAWNRKNEARQRRETRFRQGAKPAGKRQAGYDAPRQRKKA